MKQLLILAFFISCNVSAAGIQKWIDENGQIHYGDSPPVKAQSEPVRVSRPPTNPGKALPRLNSPENAEADTTPQQDGATQQKKAPTETTAELAKSQCEQAKKDLSTLKRTSRVRLKMDDGSVRYMTAEEMEDRKKLSEEDIKQFCK
jgi:hypothetical protein